MTRQSVRSRFERHHVDAFSAPIGYRGSLSGLDIKPIEAFGKVEHTFYIQTNHAGQSARCSGKALESHVAGGVPLGPVLLGDIREHAVARRKLKTTDELCEELLETNDRVEIAGGTIQADNHIAAAIREFFENREEDLGLIVAWA